MSKDIIGIKLADGSFYPVLTEGEPQQRQLELTTATDDQTTIQLHLYKSPSGTMRDASYVDTLLVESLIPHPKEEPSFPLHISLDENDVLSAEIFDPETGRRSDMTVSLINLPADEQDTSANFTLSAPLDFALPEEDFSGPDFAADPISLDVPDTFDVPDAFDAADTFDVPLDDFQVEADAAPLDLDDPLDLPALDTDAAALDDFQFADDAEPATTLDEPLDAGALDTAAPLDLSALDDEIPDTLGDFQLDTDEPTISFEAPAPSLDDPLDLSTIDTDEPLPLDLSALDAGEPLDEPPDLGALDDEIPAILDDAPPDGSQGLGTLDTTMPDIDSALDFIPDDPLPPPDTLLTEETFPDDLDFSTGTSADPLAPSAANDGSFAPQASFDTPIPLDNDFSTDALSEEIFPSDMDFSTDGLDDDAFSFDDIPDFGSVPEARDSISLDDLDPANDLAPFPASPVSSFAGPSGFDMDDDPFSFDDDLDPAPAQSASRKAERVKDPSYGSLFGADQAFYEESIAEEKRNQRRSRVPAIICVVCAIICVATLVIWYTVVPQHFKDLVQEWTGTVLTAHTDDIQPPEEPAAENTPAEAAPVKSDNTIVIAETPIIPASPQSQAAQSGKTPQATGTQASATQTPASGSAAAPTTTTNGTSGQAAALQAQSATTGAQATASTASTAAPRTVRYRIKWGDTLWDLAETYYRNPWQYTKIARYNGIKNPDFILAGTYIIIPE